MPVLRRESARCCDNRRTETGSAGAVDRFCSTDRSNEVCRLFVPNSRTISTRCGRRGPANQRRSNAGWSALSTRNDDRFNSGEPGVDVEVACWWVEEQVALSDADTWAAEAVPDHDKKLAFAVRAELIKDRKSRLVDIFSPIPIKGAPGSAGGPIATIRPRVDLVVRRAAGAAPLVEPAPEPAAGSR